MSWLLHLILCLLKVAADEVITILLFGPGMILGVVSSGVLRILILIHFKLTLTIAS